MKKSELKKLIKEEISSQSSINYNKWRLKYNGKSICQWIFELQDGYGNIKDYIIDVIYKFNPNDEVDEMYFSERLLGRNGGLGFSISNLQNKPQYLFNSGVRPSIDDEEEFNKLIIDPQVNNKNSLEGIINSMVINEMYDGENLDVLVRKWMRTGVYTYKGYKFR